jgi:ubiquinone/menaquinone biosynthesis C-methylase UbiE
MNANDEKKIRDTVSFYNGFSEKYDRKYAAYLHHTHDRLFDRLSDISGECILDISAGTGLLAGKILAQYIDVKLMLNDPSDGMRAVAMARFEENNSVEFSDLPAEKIDFPPESFDRVICLNSFHYYADQEKAIVNMVNVLKPNGFLHILDWNLEGWFHLPNAIISYLSHENINTRSVAETEEMLESSGLKITERRTWSYRFWKFYLIKATK